MILKITIIAAIIMMLLFTYSLMNVASLYQDEALENEEQVHYIKEYYTKKAKKYNK